jgi:hypothetical protein
MFKIKVENSNLDFRLLLFLSRYSQWSCDGKAWKLTDDILEGSRKLPRLSALLTIFAEWLHRLQSMASYTFKVLFSTFDILRRWRAEHALPVDLTPLKTLRLEHAPS